MWNASGDSANQVTSVCAMDPNPLGSASPGSLSPYVILMPVFNDWPAARLLLQHLDRELTTHRIAADVVFVDDCSTDDFPVGLVRDDFAAIRQVDVLTLRRNLGHQRALAIGLCYLAANRPCRAVVVMDADGEDLPADVPRLIEASAHAGGRRIVFARRTRRSEGVIFAIFYQFYRVAHYLLTGMKVEVGNFSVVPQKLLQRLVINSELWNHYSAAVIHSHLPTTLVPTRRGDRLVGNTHMSFGALVAHGLSAMSVYADLIGVRLLVATGVVFLLWFATFCATVAIRLFTTVAIPGWAMIVTGIALIMLSQAGLLALIFIFMIQRSRAAPSFIPARDYEIFVESFTPARSAESSPATRGERVRISNPAAISPPPH